jgi:O-antigen/teichoic acid export membrane protein
MASFSKLQDDIYQIKTYFLKFVRVTTIVIVPALAGLALIAGDAVNVIMTPKWSESILPLRILAIVGIFKCIYIVIPIMLNAKGKPKINMYYSVACAVIMPIAFYIGTLHGLNGVSYAWLAVFPWLTFVMVYTGCREAGVGFKEFALCLSPSIISSLSMMSVLVVLRELLKRYPVNSGVLGAYVVIGAFTYAGVLLIFFPGLRSDIGTFIRGGVAETG